MDILLYNIALVQILIQLMNCDLPGWHVCYRCCVTNWCTIMPCDCLMQHLVINKPNGL